MLDPHRIKETIFRLRDVTLFLFWRMLKGQKYLLV